jgi:hypothetical protein
MVPQHWKDAPFSQSHTVLLRARGVLPAQSRRYEVGVSFRGISRGENLNVWRGSAGRAVVGKLAVVQQKVHVRY